MRGHGSWVLSMLLFAVVLLEPTGAAAQQAGDTASLGTFHGDWGLPPSPGGKRLGHLLEAMTRRDEAFTLNFLASAVDPAFRDQFPASVHVQVIHETGADLGTFEVADVQRDATGAVTAVLQGQGSVTVVLQVQDKSPHRIASIGFQPEEGGDAVADTESTADGAPAETPASGSIYGRLATTAASWAARGLIGQILVVRDGAPVFEGAYGTTTGEENGPLVTPETVFAIGSITKQFTRVAVLALEEDGRLRREDRLGDLLPNVPEDKTDITVDQLLKMRAGFHEYHDNRGDHQAMTRDEALERILSQRLRFEPGSDRAYSNSGFTLLAAIVEEASGRPFATFVRERLLDPIGLDRIGFHGEKRWTQGDVARGLGPRQFLENAPDMWPAPTWSLQGGGGIVASARDLSRWVLALRGGEVLAQPQLAAAYPGPAAFYAGGDDFGFVSAVVEVGGGRTHVIATSSSGGNQAELAVLEILEVLTGEASPFG